MPEGLLSKSTIDEIVKQSRPIRVKPSLITRLSYILLPTWFQITSKNFRRQIRKSNKRIDSSLDLINNMRAFTKLKLFEDLLLSKK